METWTRDDSGQSSGSFPHHFLKAKIISPSSTAPSTAGSRTAMIEAITEDGAPVGEVAEVKTRPSRRIKHARTRHFYEDGRLPLEETDLWGADTPCLILVKPVADSAT